MNKSLTKRQYLILGSLLFGLFFGAGNLIFPIHLGQLSAGNWGPATIGFLLTAILLPLLSILAISLTRSNSAYDLAAPAGKKFALFFLILIHLTLGILVASPRTATTTFAIGIQPFLPQRYDHLGLLIFSALFFGIAYLMAYNQNKIADYVGKFLNPILLTLLAFIFFMAFVIKGDLRHISLFPTSTGAGSNLINGFLQGYNTMDALAGLGFGVTIIAALKLFGLTDSRQRSRAVAKVGAISMSLEAIIYIFLIALGASSLNYLHLSSEGGTAFTQIMTHYTGLAGTAILGAVTFLACITSCIGMMAALSQDWGERFPKLGYHFFLTVSCLGAFIIANFGLTQIILYSTPLLSFIYPFAMALIFLGVLHPLIGQNPIIYKTTVAFTLIPAILDAIHNLPPFFANLGFFKTIDAWAGNTIPLFNVGLDFFPFVLVGLGGSWALTVLLKRRTPAADLSKK
ncbi:branched-chain amino acid transport system II carrier protein [Levilactobacillus acidifarinae]|uniref:Branched-chain amino acid transport system carrier protein n=1 Tax=Levilactobacillus acidifarinae DSM 19394 = JCM 15949 TaxID=1423715 RepID=A0A0R1LT42_9LACO|nr:branched-chain amino acid transport system II carrier protein [Levilactobacillus acidifarinae]KRK96065.1 branched-chain amino acid transport system II carrier protein [Levilactobacillus acidifarinae DSM 19394]GEO69661.1 branched-chain amino acid transport system carrier protein [Levilactobacillus acidifarinae]